MTVNTSFAEKTDIHSVFFFYILTYAFIFGKYFLGGFFREKCKGLYEKKRKKRDANVAH